MLSRGLFVNRVVSGISTQIIRRYAQVAPSVLRSSSSFMEAPPLFNKELVFTNKMMVSQKTMTQQPILREVYNRITSLDRLQEPPTGTGVETIQMDSVKRKRKKMMKKHKLRKRRKAQRALKIRLKR